MSLDWFPWYPGSFKKKTLHLTLEQDGAYRRLIDEYMIQRAPLPNNDNALARILGVSVKEWLRIAPAVRAMFEEHGDKLVNERCEEEIIAQETQRTGRSQKAKHAANARWLNRLSENATSMPQASTKQSSRNARLMPHDATLHNTTKTFSVARKDGVDNLQTNPAASLASALPAGALARPPDIEPEARKRPSELTRAELDARIEARRASA